MRLPPIPIPSDASKAPVLPGLSLELFDIFALMVLIMPAFLMTKYQPHHRIQFPLVFLSAVPGLIASVPLVWMAPKEGQRGWQRLLAWFIFRFMAKKEYRLGTGYEDKWMGVKSCGKDSLINQ